MLRVRPLYITFNYDKSVSFGDGVTQLVQLAL